MAELIFFFEQEKPAFKFFVSKCYYYNLYKILNITGCFFIPHQARQYYHTECRYSQDIPWQLRCSVYRWKYLNARNSQCIAKYFIWQEH